jgi:3-dehydroquinate synthase II
MKKVWVRVIPWNKTTVTAALESGADAVIVEEGKTADVRALGRIKTVAPDGDFAWGRDVVEIEIRDKSDENRVLEESRDKIVVVKCSNWKIIPLENLISQTKGLFAAVASSDEALTATRILEKGVDGVVLYASGPGEIKKCVALVKKAVEKFSLETAKISAVKELGMGDRVCIDTCTNMHPGEGILVGNSSAAMFLVHSESVQNPYVSPRPFRVNAGGIHAYTLLPDGKTKYLSELAAGDEVLVLNHKGEQQPAIVGRIKIEKRPMLLVEAECKGRRVSLIMQNAETIRLVNEKGDPVSVVGLKEGDEILAYFESAGRHFGVKVEETITER